MILKDFVNEEATYELKKIVEMENKLDRNGFIYKTDNKKKNKTYDFQKFQTIRSFGRENCNSDLLLDDAPEQQIGLKDDIYLLKKSTEPKELVKKSANS